MTRLTGNRDALQSMPTRCPWSATGAASQRAGPPDNDHAGRGAATCGAADPVHRYAADDPAVATILTSAHGIHRITAAFSSGRISTPP